MTHEVIIIEPGPEDTSIEIYVSNSVAQPIKDELAAIKARSGHHIGALDKLRLFAILWKILP